MVVPISYVIVIAKYYILLNYIKNEIKNNINIIEDNIIGYKYYWLF